MKGIIIELRVLIAIKLIDWSFTVMPNCDLKNDLAKAINSIPFKK